MSQRNRYIAGFIVLLLVIGMASFGFARSSKNNDTRYAVFLTNGQAYFGYLDNPKSDFITLRDVYYLPPTERLQDGSSREGKKLSLRRLGSEIHGADGTMVINKNSVAFYEKMRDNSKINDAIKRYVESQSQSEETSTSSPSASPSE
jgi:hypothetical protein